MGTWIVSLLKSRLKLFDRLQADSKLFQESLLIRWWHIKILPFYLIQFQALYFDSHHLLVKIKLLLLEVLLSWILVQDRPIFFKWYLILLSNHQFLKVYVQIAQLNLGILQRINFLLMIIKVLSYHWLKSLDLSSL